MGGRLVTLGVWVGEGIRLRFAMFNSAQLRVSTVGILEMGWECIGLDMLSVLAVVEQYITLSRVPS